MSGELHRQVDRGSPALFSPSASYPPPGGVEPRLAPCALGCSEETKKGEDGLRASIQSAPPRLPEGVNERLADLIERMLTKDPARRISVGEVRSHPWVAAIAARGRDSRNPMVATDFSASMHHLLEAAA